MAQICTCNNMYIVVCQHNVCVRVWICSFALDCASYLWLCPQLVPSATSATVGTSCHWEIETEGEREGRKEGINVPIQRDEPEHCHGGMRKKGQCRGDLWVIIMVQKEEGVRACARAGCTESQLSRMALHLELKATWEQPALERGCFACHYFSKLLAPVLFWPSHLLSKAQHVAKCHSTLNQKPKLSQAACSGKH